MTIGINQLSSGMGLMIDGDLYLVQDYHHVKPGKGTAFARVKLKNIKNDTVVEKTFKTADKLEDVQLEEHELEFLYQGGGAYHFMNHETFEQVELTLDEIGSARDFLLENLTVTGLMYGQQVLKIILPIFVEAEITYAEPGLKGDSSKAGTKPARIATDATIQVPLFVEQGDRIKIDTRTAEYVERIKI
ncbi:MAG: elongation factor P [Candidatus Omnitrophota bacterium]